MTSGAPVPVNDVDAVLSYNGEEPRRDNGNRSESVVGDSESLDFPLEFG